MSTTTANMGLQLAVDTDNVQAYLESSLGDSLNAIDKHDHSTDAKSAAVGRIANGNGNVPSGTSPVGTIYFDWGASKLYVANGTAINSINAAVDTTDAPQPVGAAAVGALTGASPSDHVHALTYLDSTLAADVTLASSGWTDVTNVNVSLAPGVWLLMGKAYLWVGYPGDYAAIQVVDSTGTTVFDTSDGWAPNYQATPMTLMAYITNTGPANLTVKLRAWWSDLSGHGGTAYVYHQSQWYAGGPNVTYLRAVRIG